MGIVCLKPQFVLRLAALFLDHDNGSSNQKQGCCKNIPKIAPRAIATTTVFRPPVVEHLSVAADPQIAGLLLVVTEYVATFTVVRTANVALAHIGLKTDCASLTSVKMHIVGRQAPKASRKLAKRSGMCYRSHCIVCDPQIQRSSLVHAMLDIWRLSVTAP